MVGAVVAGFPMMNGTEVAPAGWKVSDRQESKRDEDRDDARALNPKGAVHVGAKGGEAFVANSSRSAVASA